MGSKVFEMNRIINGVAGLSGGIKARGIMASLHHWRQSHAVKKSCQPRVKELKKWWQIGVSQSNARKLIDFSLLLPQVTFH